MRTVARRRGLLLPLIAITAMLAGGGISRAQTNDGTDLSIELVDPKVLRVCADPRNLPFSNDKGEGFENKLGELFAEKLQKKLDYMYFPQATGFVRMTLAAHRCDVIMGFPQGDDLVQGTNPYYRTAYALVAKQGSGLDEVATLGDERLKGKHIGIVAGTPPATNMAVNGLMADAKPYPLMIDTRIDSSAEAMINDLTSGKIDAAILWGPMAGFYAKKANPPLHVTPLVKETTGPAARLSHRHGRAAGRPELEAAAQPSDPGEPAGHQQDTARLRRSLARRERPADRRGDGDEVAMMRKLAGLVLAAFAFVASASAQERPARTRRIPHGRLSRAGSGNARRRARAHDRGGRSDLARQAGRFHRRAAACAKAAKSSRRARSGATSRGSTFPAASGCPTPATESWRRRPKTICGAGLPARPAATRPRCS